jgi:hypothetical protein
MQPLARWLTASGVLACFILAELGLGGAVTIIWPSPLGGLSALALSSVISAAGGVFTANVILQGGATS